MSRRGGNGTWEDVGVTPMDFDPHERDGLGHQESAHDGATRQSRMSCWK